MPKMHCAPGALVPQVPCPQSASQSKTALQCLWLVSQVLNSYGKVFPTQPPSGRPVREAAPQGPSWERHVDVHDLENPPDRLERKRSIGEPAWCHSDSKRKLSLQQVQLEALAGSSSAGATAQPATSNYDRRKQERLQAIRSLSWLVLSALLSSLGLAQCMTLPSCYIGASTTAAGGGFAVCSFIKISVPTHQNCIPSAS